MFLIDRYLLITETDTKLFWTHIEAYRYSVPGVDAAIKVSRSWRMPFRTALMMLFVGFSPENICLECGLTVGQYSCLISRFQNMSSVLYSVGFTLESIRSHPAFVRDLLFQSASKNNKNQMASVLMLLEGLKKAGIRIEQPSTPPANRDPITAFPQGVAPSSEVVPVPAVETPALSPIDPIVLKNESIVEGVLEKIPDEGRLQLIRHFDRDPSSFIQLILGQNTEENSHVVSSSDEKKGSGS